MSSPAAIERLRTAVNEAPQEVKITLPQVQSVVSGLVACDDLSDVAAASGLSPAQVLDLVAEFGTWLTHVHGGSGAVTKTAASMSQLPLLQLPLAPPAPAGKAAAPKKATAAKTAKAGDAPVVIVPLGFEKGAAHGRDVSKALASVVVRNPDAEEITRFLSRKYRATVRTLTYGILESVWYFAVLGRIEEIDELAGNSLELSRLLVAGYDTLELARTDAIAAMAVLCKQPPPSGIDEMRDAAMRCRWVAEGPVSRLERSIALAETNPAARGLLDAELSSFAAMVRQSPRTFVISNIAEMNSAQLLRVAEAAGIATEAPDRATETEIRKGLQDMGLAADVDRYVPEGLRAYGAGAAEVFWDAMERLTSGDPDWDAELRDALDATTTAV